MNELYSTLSHQHTQSGEAQARSRRDHTVHLFASATGGPAASQRRAPNTAWSGSLYAVARRRARRCLETKSQDSRAKTSLRANRFLFFAPPQTHGRCNGEAPLTNPLFRSPSRSGSRATRGAHRDSYSRTAVMTALYTAISSRSDAGRRDGYRRFLAPHKDSPKKEISHTHTHTYTYGGAE